ncbi:MAG: D-alanine--D-alanine ligase [Candidatus Pacebacteria bacterium]|nr:D-alanine--D-alanine ligase [Candidatus Paceibacterota bacterium]
MSRLHVGVLRGGPSSEYDVSLASGAAVLENLSEDKYDVTDILISRDGKWHSRGLPIPPERALQKLDVALIALHGEYGEDGSVQKILNAYNIAYAGSGVLGSTLAMNKGQAKTRVGTLDGVKMPGHVVLHLEDVQDSLQEAVQNVFSKFGPGYIVKPLRGGSSVGILVADSISALPDVLAEAFESTDSVIVEQFIQGREGTCGIVENLRNEQLYSLPPVEIIAPKTEGFWDYESKYDDEHELICPGNFTTAEKQIMQNAARSVHNTLGLRHYSRSDFIVAPSGIYFLEVNTLPGLTPTSLLPKSLESIGMTFPDFLDHLVELALMQHRVV